MIKLDHIFIIYILFLPGFLVFIAFNYLSKVLLGSDLFVICSDSFVNGSWAVLMSIIFGFFLRSMAQWDSWFFSKFRLYKFMEEIFIDDKRSRHTKDLSLLFRQNFQKEYDSAFGHSDAFNPKKPLSFYKIRRKIGTDINHVYHQLQRSGDIQPIHDLRDSINFLESLILALTYIALICLAVGIAMVLAMCPPHYGCLWTWELPMSKLFVIAIGCIAFSIPLRSHLKHLDKSYLLGVIISFNQLISK